jgi:hypothetical protein
LFWTLSGDTSAVVGRNATAGRTSDVLVGTASWLGAYKTTLIRSVTSRTDAPRTFVFVVKTLDPDKMSSNPNTCPMVDGREVESWCMPAVNVPRWYENF